MLRLTKSLGDRWRLAKLVFDLVVSAVAIVAALTLCIYPAVTICLVTTDSQLNRTGESRLVPYWFKSATGRFIAWADDYLGSSYAGSIHHNDIPATEWPMFGAAFYLVTAQDMQDRGQIDATQGTIRQAVDKAAEIVASPVTGTWVRTKWGEGYRDRENVFYRMLFILGLSSYEKITGSTQYRPLMSQQRATLSAELAGAKFHLRDDYPGECYPADMLWAVAAIQRAGRLEGADHAELVRGLMTSFDGPMKAPEGLPAFQADSRSGGILQGARGCGNSGIIIFAAELDRAIAGQWYDAYERRFWKDTGWIAGFTEMPRGARDAFADVDSGPVLCEIGSVSSAFGIGAAKAVGRYDHAAPMTAEMVACSWPTPFGFLIPGVMGRVAAKSWSLGEVAMLFSMTRPTLTENAVPFRGRHAAIVWIMLAFYAGSGVFLIWFEIRTTRRRIRRYRETVLTKRRALASPSD
ncbi:MAG: hypothetical protein ABFC96_14475 [Thermoguttaceae bacterium]